MKLTKAELDRIVAARAKRQTLLSEPGRRWQGVIGETALWSAPGTREVQLDQLDHLVVVSELPGVELGMIPLRAPMPVPALSGFRLLDDEEMRFRSSHQPLPPHGGLYGSAADVPENATLGEKLPSVAPSHAAIAVCEVHDVADILARIVDRLRELNGAGLAAPQLGVSVKEIVVEVSRTTSRCDLPQPCAVAPSPCTPAGGRGVARGSRGFTDIPSGGHVGVDRATSWAVTPCS